MTVQQDEATGYWVVKLINNWELHLRPNKVPVWYFHTQYSEFYNLWPDHHPGEIFHHNVPEHVISLAKAALVAHKVTI
jgi:hypothetical protein